MRFQVHKNGLFAQAAFDQNLGRLNAASSRIVFDIYMKSGQRLVPAKYH
jgi:hypothetical protein